MKILELLNFIQETPFLNLEKDTDGKIYFSYLLLFSKEKNEEKRLYIEINDKELFKQYLLGKVDLWEIFSKRPSNMLLIKTTFSTDKILERKIAEIHLEELEWYLKNEFFEDDLSPEEFEKYLSHFD